jgi:hypothetical protein
MNEPVIAKLNENGQNFDRLLPAAKPKDTTTSPHDPRSPAGIHLEMSATDNLPQVKGAHKTGATLDLVDLRQPKQELAGTVARPSGSAVTTRSL